MWRSPRGFFGAGALSSVTRCIRLQLDMVVATCRWFLSHGAYGPVPWNEELLWQVLPLSILTLSSRAQLLGAAVLLTSPSWVYRLLRRQGQLGRPWFRGGKRGDKS